MINKRIFGTIQNGIHGWRLILCTSFKNAKSTVYEVILITMLLLIHRYKSSLSICLDMNNSAHYVCILPSLISDHVRAPRGCTGTYADRILPPPQSGVPAKIASSWRHAHYIARAERSDIRTIVIWETTLHVVCL